MSNPYYRRHSLDNKSFASNSYVNWMRTSLYRHFCRRVDDLHHVIRPKSNDVCQVHKYFGLEPSSNSLMYCTTCHVCMCVDCFKPFHEIESINQLREEVKKNNEKYNK